MVALKLVPLTLFGGVVFIGSVFGQSLPTVDLGYQVQRASSFNATGQFYNFSNIRFAQAPVGELRWVPPVAPTDINRTINDGTQFGPICPQAQPDWEYIGAAFTQAFALGQAESFNYTAAAALASLQPTPQVDPRTSEDCLFLDVFAPKTIFDAANTTTKSAPVLVWIYGGGYTSGSKVSSGNPASLLDASQVDTSEGIVFVAMNYRLGALGWLAGPTISGNGTQNVGLYDQRFALEWIQQHISKFGGDPKRVTIMGESAGGGSVMHQITAFAGTKPVPFQQAILQSAAWFPLTSSWGQEQTDQQFLQILNVSTLEEARKLPSSALIEANSAQIGGAPYGTFIYSPAVGGQFAPDLPGKLLLSGSFAKDLKVMVGHNTYEGVLFTDPRTNNESYQEAYLRSSFPSIQPSVLDYIVDDLYPPIYNGSLPYTSPIQRAIFIITEAFFTCNTLYIDRAFNNASYAYQFSIFPAIHGQDVSYTWWNGGASLIAGLSTNVTVARVMQELFTSFAETGSPVSPTWGGDFTRYTNLDQELDLNTTAIKMVRDDTANERCVWWQKALYE